MTLKQVDQELAFHADAIADNHGQMIQALSTPQTDVAGLRAVTQRINVLNGENHSRLSQMRTLRWVRKQLVKERQESDKAVEAFNAGIRDLKV